MNFESQIVHLFVLLSQNHSHSTQITMNVLYQLLVSIQSQPQFELLYNMIFYVRDIHHGLGERNATYLMIYIWSFVNPTLAIQALYRIVYDGFGSWRDVKGFCRFVREYSIHQDMDPLIHTCVEMINYQLIFDNLLENPNELSLVSKWIPRENSAFHWLYEKCVLHWIHLERPEYLSTVRTEQQLQRAVRKGKKEYRGIISKLSRTLNIPQIKQCGRDWASISRVSFHTLQTQRNAFLNISSTGNPRLKSMHDLDRIICSETFGTKQIKCATSVDVGNLVKQSIFMREEIYSNMLENIWNALSTLIPIKGNLLPLLDFTAFPLNEQFFDALGLALIIATKSPIKNRILGFDQTPIWIESQDTFINSLQHLKNIYTEKNIGPSSIQCACEFLIQSMIHTNVSQNAVNNMTLVVFSDFSLQSIHELHRTLTKLFLDAGYSYAPVFLYWNLNSSAMIEDTSLVRACIISGISIPLLQHIGSLSIQDWKNVTPFDFISKLIPR